MVVAGETEIRFWGRVRVVGREMRDEEVGIIGAPRLERAGGVESSDERLGDGRVKCEGEGALHLRAIGASGVGGDGGAREGTGAKGRFHKNVELGRGDRRTEESDADPLAKPADNRRRVGSRG